MKKKNLLVIALLGVLTVGTIGGAYAYFTNVSQRVDNNFTFVTGGGPEDVGEVKEPGWEEIPEDDKKNLQPNATLVKDPQFMSNSDYPSYVYLEVTLPTATQADEDNSNIIIGQIQPDGDIQDVTATKGTELVILNTDESNNKWTRLGKKEEDGKVTYLYGYSDIVAPKATTQPVFNSFTVPNFKKYKGTTALNISVISRAIQAEGNKANDFENYATLFGADAAGFTAIN